MHWIKYQGLPEVRERKSACADAGRSVGQRWSWAPPETNQAPTDRPSMKYSNRFAANDFMNYSHIELDSHTHTHKLIYTHSAAAVGAGLKLCVLRHQIEMQTWWSAQLNCICIAPAAACWARKGKSRTVSSAGALSLHTLKCMHWIYQNV
jgi:hypothetical protein